jgi:nucleotide-binding universal stress UspA family protein
MANWGFGKTIIWAIDAFETSKKFYRDAAKILEMMSEGKDTTVEPVYVLNTSQLDLSGESSGVWLQRFRDAAEKALNKILLDIQSSIVLKRPHILLQMGSSNTEATELVSDYVMSVDADLVVVSTHGRSGMSRLLLGSFAETLILKSLTPVFVVGPEIRKLNSLDQAVFATDFGPHAKEVFRKVVQMAQGSGVKLTLFHSIPHPVEPIFQSGVYLLGGSWVPVHAYFGLEVTRQSRRAEVWTRWAKSQGVDADYYIHSEGGAIASALIELAKRKRAGWIAMEGQSGPIAAALLGSITRQVIRNAPCPVWVVPHSAVGQKGVSKINLNKPAA